MCMFCAALPMVLGVTAAAQGEQRKRMQAAQAHQPDEARAAAGVLASERSPIRPIIRPLPRPSRRITFQLSPRQITGIGAAAFVALLMGSALYHTSISS